MTERPTAVAASDSDRRPSPVADLVFVTIEKYLHVKRLVVSYWGHPVQLALELNRARISAANPDATGPAEILFDCHIAAHRVRSTPVTNGDDDDGAEYLTCPITLDMKRDHDLDLPSAAELSYRDRLLCRACSRPVADLSGLRKALPLPSDHWVEMSELWVCDPHTMSTMTTPYGLPERPLDEAAIADVLLVGVRDVIVPDDVMVMASARCTCGCELGELVLGGVRLWKRTIRAEHEPLFAFYTPETDAVAQILQHCHSQSLYLVEVACTTGQLHQRLLYLQICNWDSFAIQATFRVIDGRVELQDRIPSNSKRFAPVVKTLFSLQRQPIQLPASFRASSKFEKLQLPEEQFDAICEALLNSNEQLPPRQRKLGDMSLGLLSRLSRII